MSDWAHAAVWIALFVTVLIQCVQAEECKGSQGRTAKGKAASRPGTHRVGRLREDQEQSVETNRIRITTTANNGFQRTR